MKLLPSRPRRLDDALAELPFLTGVLVCPDLIMPSEWLPIVWGAEESGGAPFDDPADVRWFAEAVMARYNEIVRDLGRGKQQPIFDVDERNGDVLWELWVDGFGRAIALRPDSWAVVAGDDDEEAADALAYLSMLVAIARNESSLDSLEINAVHEDAPAGITDSVARLHAFRLHHGALLSQSPAVRPARVGRNDPCPCGSGKKFKRCCS